MHVCFPQATRGKPKLVDYRAGSTVDELTRTTTAQIKVSQETSIKPRRTQAERSAETRRKLIEAATEVLCERGYANTTMLHIAKRAGVSRGASQHHFGTRYDLFDAVAEQLTEKMRALTENLSFPELSLEDRVDIAIDFYWNLYNSQTFNAILHIYLGTSDPNDPHKFHRSVANAYLGSDRPWFDLFHDAAMPKKELRALRRVVLATLRGLAVGRVLGIVSSSVNTELRLLKSMTSARLGSAEGQS
jgi:AcrR family transcriptional regulator